MSACLSSQPLIPDETVCPPLPGLIRHRGKKSWKFRLPMPFPSPSFIRGASPILCVYPTTYTRSTVADCSPLSGESSKKQLLLLIYMHFGHTPARMVSGKEMWLDFCLSRSPAFSLFNSRQWSTAKKMFGMKEGEEEEEGAYKFSFFAEETCGQTSCNFYHYSDATAACCRCCRCC